MRFKVACLTCSYDNCTIESIDTSTSTNIHEMCKTVSKIIAHNYNGDLIDECYGQHYIYGNIGFISQGQDNILVVIPESSVWYRKLNNHKSWSEIEKNNWEQLIQIVV